MLSKALCPQPWGECVGGADGGPARETKRSNPLACPSRNGGRHPGSQDAVSLRGRAVECESWSVRLACRRLVLRQAFAPMTTGALWKKEEGNVVSVRQAHALFEVTPKKRRPERGHVLHSVQRPVHVNRHWLSRCNGASRQPWGCGASALISRSGKPTEVGRTGTGI